ncbi:MAG: peptide chain release factor 2 [Desulfosalsimonadaceae bacterium]
MSVELKQSISDLYQQLDQLRSIFDLPGKEKRLDEIEEQIADAGFWEDQDSARSVLKERARLTEQIEKWNFLYRELEDCDVLLELAEEEEDSASAEEAGRKADQLSEQIKRFSLQLVLDGDDDDKNAIVSINAGAGGTEAQDWAEMLFRMYARWMERRGFMMEMIDLQEGDEAGIKSVTFSVAGQYAFGYLKVEVGIHRLVRISPFNANGKRHTSFASVFVYPELDEKIEVDIDESDLRIDTYRAQGAGGQHVNKTSSAVRITHLPTNIVVQCQQEKSQIRNRELAMKVLRSRLYQLEKEKQDQRMQELHESKDEIAWGNQIRSYVLHPYQMVKDHRVNIEIGNVDSVLDGDIDLFIEKVLLSGKAEI